MPSDAQECPILRLDRIVGEFREGFGLGETAFEASHGSLPNAIKRPASGTPDGMYG
jgi:hypothetical protein